MLYFIVFYFTKDIGLYEELFAELNRIGDVINAFENCYMIKTVLTPAGIRKHLLPYLDSSDEFVVCKMCRNYCAGKLKDRSKQFVRDNICPDPAPYQKPKDYYSF